MATSLRLAINTGAVSNPFGAELQSPSINWTKQTASFLDFSAKMTFIPCPSGSERHGQVLTDNTCANVRRRLDASVCGARLLPVARDHVNDSQSLN